MNRLVILLIIIFLTGCEKKIDFQLDKAEPKLVVEATIENGSAPIVFLSRSQNYFSRISPAELANSFVHDAKITISNGIKTHQLKEYALSLGGGFSAYYYSIDSSNLSTSFIGELNHKYNMEILSEGKTYSAQTTIPLITRRVDSLWWKPASTDTADKEVQVIIKAYDPPGFGDFVRYWTKKNHEAFLPGFTSVYDDLVIDGTTYELNVEPGVDRNKDNGYDPEMFKRGDTVTLKISNIDKATYDFWRTMEYSYSSIGNPFSTPVKVINNISNGALGYFGGYASQYRSIIIPR